MALALSQPVRTQRITAYVTSLQMSPPVYLAVLDGGGERFPQQFKIAELCEYLCIVLDHNKSDSDSTVDEARLSEHQQFLNQVRHHLEESNTQKKEWVHFLLNKHDLWQRASDTHKEQFQTFCSAELDRWKQGRFSAGVNSSPHSNSAPDDVAKFVTLLKESVRR